MKTKEWLTQIPRPAENGMFLSLPDPLRLAYFNDRILQIAIQEAHSVQLSYIQAIELALCRHIIALESARRYAISLHGGASLDMDTIGKIKAQFNQVAQ